MGLRGGGQRPVFSKNSCRVVGISASHPQGPPGNLLYRISGPLTQQMPPVTGNLYPAYFLGKPLCSQVSFENGLSCKVPSAPGIASPSVLPAAAPVWELCSGSCLGDKASPFPSQSCPGLPQGPFLLELCLALHPISSTFCYPCLEPKGADPRDTQQEGR